MSTLVLPPPSTAHTARCSCCGLEITTRRRTYLPSKGCPRCLPGRLRPQDPDLLQMIHRRSPPTQPVVVPGDGLLAPR